MEAGRADQHLNQHKSLVHTFDEHAVHASNAAPVSFNVPNVPRNPRIFAANATRETWRNCRQQKPGNAHLVRNSAERRTCRVDTVWTRSSCAASIGVMQQIYKQLQVETFRHQMEKASNGCCCDSNWFHTSTAEAPEMAARPGRVTVHCWSSVRSVIDCASHTAP
eukprot:SAG31_NODE_1629_length_7702_cov_6.380902_3_plen_165_part_00